MMSPRKSLGVMRPLGGGDTIPLKKEELVVGRRPKCDIQLDFENISGKHAMLRYSKGTWYVRDLGSTNGTTVNGTRISSEHAVLPDDELGISGHYFALDYDAADPTAMANAVLGEELGETSRRKSLLELAGLENTDAPSRPRPPANTLAEKAPRPSHVETMQEAPASVQPAEAKTLPTDDDFFDMIKGDVINKDKPRR